jgi:hypothetical protein
MTCEVQRNGATRRAGVIDFVVELGKRSKHAGLHRRMHCQAAIDVLQPMFFNRCEPLLSIAALGGNKRQSKGR